MELGFSDPDNDVDTSGCYIQEITLDIGTVPAGTQQTVKSNVRVDDGYLVLEGESGCDSLSYMIIKSGHDGNRRLYLHF